MVRRLFLLCAILALTGITGPACAFAQSTSSDTFTLEMSPSDPQGAIKAARALVASGNMQGAIDNLESYVRAHPGELEPHRFLGDLYVRTGQLDRAKVVYLAILAVAPNDKETHNRLGTVYAVQNDIDAAIAQFTSALPGTDSVDDLVTLHERRGDLAKYEANIIDLARSNPDDPGVQSEMGQVYNALGEPYLATRYFMAALDASPDDLTSMNGLGLSYLDLHEYGQAAEQFEKCLRIDSEAYSCADNLGATQLEEADFKAAKTSLDRAYRMAPERAQTFVNYGYLDDAQGNWKEAIAQYARAIAAWPFIREAYIDIGISYEDHHLYSLAQQVLVKGIASVHDDGRLHFLLGVAYEMQGNKTDALTEFKIAEAGSDPAAKQKAVDSLAELDSVATPRPQ